MKYDQKRFKEYQVRRLTISKGHVKKPKHTKGSAVYTRARLMPDSVKEHLAKTRLDLFGSEEPPFNNIEEMGEWLNTEMDTQPPAEGHAPRYGYKLDIDTSFEELKRLHQEKPGLYGIEIASLAYPTKDGWTSNVIVSDGTRLRRLWLAVRWVAEKLDCQEAKATALILTGELPIVSALYAEAPIIINMDEPSRGKIIITIREPVPEDELLRAYRKLRQSLWGDIKHRSQINEGDGKLVEFVIRNLDPDNPQWESLMKRWNEECPDWAYHEDSGWRGFRGKYMRAKQKIYPEIHWGPMTIKN